jgi:hypothetical protein
MAPVAMRKDMRSRRAGTRAFGGLKVTLEGRATFIEMGPEVSRCWTPIWGCFDGSRRSRPGVSPWGEVEV